MANRRQFIKGSAVGLTSLTGLAGCLGSGEGTTTVSILTWTGFEEVQEEIEEELDNVELDYSFADGSAEMFATVNAGDGEEFDIAVPNNEYVPRFMQADLAAPMDMDIVTNYDGMYDRFQEAAESQFEEDGEIYGLPAQFGWYSYGYDATVLPEDHTHSFDVLFSEEYEGVDLSGSIALFDGFHKTIMATGLHLGYEEAFEGDEISFSDDQLETIEETLIDHKEHLLGFVHDAEALTQEYQQGNLIASYANRTTHLSVEDNGFEDIEFAQPAENELTWFEGAVVTQGSDNQEEAWEVLNAYIDPEIGATLAERRLIPNTSQEAQENISGEHEDRLTIEPETLEDMIPFKAAADEEAWIEAFERVKEA